jgi:phytoene dehydrogenase-like protein
VLARGGAGSYAARVRLDAVVVGAGPNGLAAAITLARAGHSVVVLEANEMAGGGVRSGPLTGPGYIQDLCSAVYPMAAGSPFFATLPLAEHGLRWVHPPVLLAHPFDDGTAATMERDLEQTVRGLGEDGPAYRRLVGTLARRWQELAPELLAPVRLPGHPLALARFGLAAMQPAVRLFTRRFRTTAAAALMGGLAAHSFVPLEMRFTSAIGLMLTAAAHAVGWPFVAGGAQALTDALVAVLRAHGGMLETGRHVRSLDELPDARAILLDLTPRQVLAVAGGRLPSRYRAALGRYRYGPAAFKIDYALKAPIPWTAEACRRAGTVHLGGPLDEIAAAERNTWAGVPPERPFVLVAQPSLFDPSRAPAGKHTAWAYCHVPHACQVDMTAALERQIERFAPGFRDVVLARRTRSPAELEAGNANLVGGDLSGGANDARQIFARPVFRFDPYATPVPGLYLCSSSTPPGAGVHGMCGHLAARSALRFLGRQRS